MIITSPLYTTILTTFMLTLIFSIIFAFHTILARIDAATYLYR